jgi:hypothetical protein
MGVAFFCGRIMPNIGLRFSLALQAAEKVQFERSWEGTSFTRAAKSFKMCPRFSA